MARFIKIRRLHGSGEASKLPLPGHSRKRFTHTMNSRTSFSQAVALARVAVMAGLLLTVAVFTQSCGKSEPSASKPPAKRATKVRERPASELQTTLDELRGQPFEFNPARRPAIISAPAPTRADWVFNALLSGAKETGLPSADSNADMTNAFRAFAKFTRDNADSERQVMMTSLTNLLRAGSADPMVNYLVARYRVSADKQSAETYAIALAKAHARMFKSKHHPLFKFVSGLRACETARQADERVDLTAQTHATTLALQDLMRDTNAAPAEVLDNVLFWTGHIRGGKWTGRLFRDLMPYMEQYWGTTEQYHRWRGWIEVDLAWTERGSGYSDTVSEDGWDGFRKHLDASRDHLEEAWRMNTNNPQTAYLLMNVELGQGEGMERMKLWFGRAMALNTNNADATSMMAYYLEPRWYGSEAATLAFGRACASSTRWGGQVPLQLYNTHNSLARYRKQGEDPAYWHQPHVWKDIQASFEKYFKLNPQDTSWRHNYAKCAFLCGQPEAFLAQARLFPHTNYGWWGGKEKFEAMVAKAASGVK